MSDDQIKDSIPKDQQANEGSQESEYVSKKVAEDYKNDMHKYKQRSKELQAKANELELKLKSIDEEKLIEQNRFKELYEKQKQENEQLKMTVQEKEQKFLDNMKIQRLKSELGGNIKDEYLKFANLSAISIGEDGSLSPDSVREVANKFRQEHPGLLPKSDNVNITGQAAYNGSVQELSYEEALKKVSTQKEFDALRAKYGRN